LRIAHIYVAAASPLDAHNHARKRERAVRQPVFTAGYDVAIVFAKSLLAALLRRMRGRAAS